MQTAQNGPCVFFICYDNDFSSCLFHVVDLFTFRNAHKKFHDDIRPWLESEDARQKFVEALATESRVRDLIDISMDIYRGRRCSSGMDRSIESWISYFSGFRIRISDDELTQEDLDQNGEAVLWNIQNDELTIV